MKEYLDSHLNAPEKQYQYQSYASPSQSKHERYYSNRQEREADISARRSMHHANCVKDYIESSSPNTKKSDKNYNSSGSSSRAMKTQSS